LTVKSVSIPQFPGGKRFAVTFSFDDGPSCDRRVVEGFNEWGLKGTFNLNSGFLKPDGAPQADEYATLHASTVREVYAGHEVAVHTVSHPHLPRLTAEQIVAEVWDDRRALEDLVGYPVRGMAYPFGTYNREVIEVLRSLGIRYSRTVENADPCFPPAEPLAWPATMHMYDTSQGDAPTRFQNLRENPRAAGVFYVWGHTYEFGRKDDLAGIERLFKPLSGHDDVWYCTNIELFDYEDARKRIAIAANRQTAYNPNGIAVTVVADGRKIELGPGETRELS
jgi:peptidoglycan/xylan/chitin deacetylase (PgdA/CDA1 family)